MAYRIGQYFKENELKNQLDGGNRPKEQSPQHLLAHAILGAATSYATGNDITSSALAGVTSEVAAPILAEYLYHTDDPEKLTQEQKDTITGILTLTTIAANNVVGKDDANIDQMVNDVSISENAVGWNYLVTVLGEEEVAASDEVKNYNYYELFIRMGLVDIDDVPNDIFESVAKIGLKGRESVTAQDIKETMSKSVLNYKQESFARYSEKQPQCAVCF